MREEWKHVMEVVLPFSGLSLALGYGVLVLATILLLLPTALPELGRPRDAIWSLPVVVLGCLLLINHQPLFSGAGLEELVVAVLMARLATEVGQERWAALSPEQKVALRHLPRWRQAAADLASAVLAMVQAIWEAIVKVAKVIWKALVKAAQAGWSAVALVAKAAWGRVASQDPVELFKSRFLGSSAQKPARKLWVRSDSSPSTGPSPNGDEDPPGAPGVATSTKAHTSLTGDSTPLGDTDNGKATAPPRAAEAGVASPVAEEPVATAPAQTVQGSEQQSGEENTSDVVENQPEPVVLEQKEEETSGATETPINTLTAGEPTPAPPSEDSPQTVQGSEQQSGEENTPDVVENQPEPVGLEQKEEETSGATETPINTLTAGEPTPAPPSQASQDSPQTVQGSEQQSGEENTPGVIENQPEPVGLEQKEEEASGATETPINTLTAGEPTPAPPSEDSPQTVQGSEQQSGEENTSDVVENQPEPVGLEQKEEETSGATEIKATPVDRAADEPVATTPASPQGAVGEPTPAPPSEDSPQTVQGSEQQSGEENTPGVVENQPEPVGLQGPAGAPASATGGPELTVSSFDEIDAWLLRPTHCGKNPLW